MLFEQFAERLLFSILIGALVGVEREHARKASEEKNWPIFGLRTTIIFAVLGFLFTYLALETNNPSLISIGALAALILTTVTYISNVWLKQHTGSTTYIAMMVVFFSGAIVGLGGYTNYLIAATLSITTTVVLVLKRMLVGWTHKLTFGEIIAALKFGIIAFIILPLLPNKPIDPFGVFNPFQIWYVIVLVSAIYFVSYVAMKHLSYKGLWISSFFGGFISGSITVYQLAEWLRKKKGLFNSVVFGVFLACVTAILGDIIVIVFVFNALDLLYLVLPAKLIGISVLLIFALISYEKNKKKHKIEIKLESPFAIIPALKFGLLYLVLIALSTVFSHYFGNLGLIPVAFFGSLVSSATFVASTAGLAKVGAIGLNTAAQLIIFASIVAMMVKVLWVQHAKNIRLTRQTLFGVSAASIAMAITMIIQFYIL
jgi:uncharacterized membrane protein (DUF4010 family)